MANGGWHGTEEEWQQAESPLLPLDPVLEKFADDHKITLSKNGKDWPERSLRWTSDEVSCLIQIFAENLVAHTFNFWICAYQDRDGGRYWKEQMLKRDTKISAIENEFSGLLSVAKKSLDEWCLHPEEFELAGKLPATPKRS
jgi:hypothetical protein